MSYELITQLSNRLPFPELNNNMCVKKMSFSFPASAGFIFSDLLLCWGNGLCMSVDLKTISQKQSSHKLLQSSLICCISFPSNSPLYFLPQAIILHFQILRGSTYFFYSLPSLRASPPAGTQVTLWQPARGLVTSRGRFSHPSKPESHATVLGRLHRAFKDIRDRTWIILFTCLSQSRG